MASRLNRPGWKILGGLALAGGLWFGLPRLLRGLEFFRVRRVEVRGLVNQRAEAVVRALPVPPGMSIFDPLDPIQAVAESLPGIDEVRVGRRLPGTVVVSLTEAGPVALVMRRGRLQLMSEAGEVLPFDPTVAAPDLPVAREPDSLVAGVLARIRAVDPTLFAAVVSGWRADDGVILTVNGRRYRFGAEPSAEVIRAVTAVAQDLTRRNRPWTELDARFAGQIVVRREAA